jgi:hypothetical protein
MVKNWPFLSMMQQIMTVGIDVSQLQLIDAPLDSLANLFANLAKAGPAHPQSR